MPRARAPHRPRRLRAALLAAALPLLAACGGDDDGGWQGSVETRGDGVVVVRSPEQGMWAEGEGWTAEEDLRIGSMDAEGPTLFGSVAAVEVDGSGRVWVLERNAKELRVFDAAGRHVRTVGRDGAGPGEFRDPIGLAWAPDGTLWIADPGNVRYTVYDTAGRHVGEHPRRISGYTIPWRGGFGTDGRLYEIASTWRGQGDPSQALLRLDSAGNPADTLHLPQHRGQQFDLRHKGGSVSAAVPFTGGLVAVPDPRGFVWTGFTDRYRLVQQRLTGDTARVIEREAAPVPVSAVEREEALKGLDWFREQGGRVDASRIPARKPAFQYVVVDTGGVLWVHPSLPAGAGAAFDVFDAQGRYQGRVPVPGGLAGYPPPVIRGGALYGVAMDSLEVPYVVRVRIRRGGERGQ